MSCLSSKPYLFSSSLRNLCMVTNVIFCSFLLSLLIFKPKLYVTDSISMQWHHTLLCPRPWILWFSTIWLRLQSQLSCLTYQCYISLTMTIQIILNFFYYLTSKVEQNLLISMLGWFQYLPQNLALAIISDQPAEQAFSFAAIHNLEQLVQHSTCIPDHLGDEIKYSFS